MCVCIYIYIYICIYIYIYTHIYTHTHTLIHTYTPARDICLPRSRPCKRILCESVGRRDEGKADQGGQSQSCTHVCLVLSMLVLCMYMNAYVCICMYVNVCICICMVVKVSCVYLYMCARARVSGMVSICMYVNFSGVYMYVCSRVCIYMHVYIYSVVLEAEGRKEMDETLVKEVRARVACMSVQCTCGCVFVFFLVIRVCIHICNHVRLSMCVCHHAGACQNSRQEAGTHPKDGQCKGRRPCTACARIYPHI